MLMGPIFDNGPINVDCHVYKITDLYNTYFNVQNENTFSEIIYSHCTPACQIHKLDEN